MLSKKLYRVFALMFVVAALLATCGGSTDTPAQTAPADTAQAPAEAATAGNNEIAQHPRGAAARLSIPSPLPARRGTMS